MLLQNAYSKLSSFAPFTLGLSSQILTEQHTHLVVGKHHFIGKLVLRCHMPTCSWHSVLLTLSQTPFYPQGAYFTLKVTGPPHPTLPTKGHISFLGNGWPDTRILKTPANLGTTLWGLFFNLLHLSILILCFCFLWNIENRLHILKNREWPSAKLQRVEMEMSRWKGKFAERSAWSLAAALQRTNWVSLARSQLIKTLCFCM